MHQRHQFIIKGYKFYWYFSGGNGRDIDEVICEKDPKRMLIRKNCHNANSKTYPLSENIHI